jgi:hypothetical protein
MSTYSPPDLELLRYSYETIWACRYQGAEGLCVVDVRDIHSVVAVVPLPRQMNVFFVAEKLGLDIAILGGVEDEEPE